MQKPRKRKKQKTPQKKNRGSRIVRGGVQIKDGKLDLEFP